MKLAGLLHISSSPYLNAIVSLSVFILIAGITKLILNRFFRKFIKHTRTDLDDRLLNIIHGPVFFTIILVGLMVSVSYLHPQDNIIFYIDGAVFSIITVIWSIVIISSGRIIIRYTISNISDVTGLKKDIIPLIENTFLIIVIIVSIFIILNIWKINITPLLASAGIAGAILALAAKDTAANFFGGISIFIDRPFKIGDYIVLDAKERGEVVSIGIRSTRIKTRDDILITVPNSIIANSKIVNESAPVPKFRVRIPASIAYGSDIDAVEKILLEIASANKHVVENPGPRVRFREFGDSSLNFELLCWVTEPSVRGLTIHELNCSIYKKFNENGITIPFPQRDVHLFQEKNKGT
ncbi:mechanosensitive channel MscK precursor [bacterium BMS3Abin07]|nr:mechanosensitive channel MscK precursor [bacterium BMS3Abin07]GBE32914.1 mechanosensitive channel MscK precursor [bacterium BMS3Bbin05]